VANTSSNPLMPNVPSFFAPWTHFEILITVSAQQHTPVARPKSLLTGKDVKAERMANWGPSGGKQWEHPYRLGLLRMRCPLGEDDRCCEGICSGEKWAWCAHPRSLADRRRHATARRSSQSVRFTVVA
jgi:hypothetical protein